MAERMSPNFAVFNGHVNNADKRARASLREGIPAWLKEVEELEAAEGGIMAIFHHKPTAATGAYVALVTHFVNEGRSVLE